MMGVVIEKVKGSFDRYAKLLPFPGPHLCPPPIGVSSVEMWNDKWVEIVYSGRVSRSGSWHRA